MVQLNPSLILIGGATVAAATGLLKSGGKTKKFVDFTKGVLGDFFLGAGSGAFLNYLDGKFANGTLQNFNSSMIGLGAPGKGTNINGTDLLVMAGTVGLGINKNALKRGLPFILGKKIGEFTGAIDPVSPSTQQTILSANSGVRTS